MKPLFLAIALLLAPVATPGSVESSWTPPDSRPGVPLPVAASAVQPDASSTALTEPASLYGPVSWYRYRPGQAAAGPALRSWLGSRWRGTTVRVCTLHHCVVVTLTDTCQCYRGTGHEVLLDLDRAAFAHLAPLSQGIVRALITVQLGAPEPRPTAPATDSMEVAP